MSIHVVMKRVKQSICVGSNLTSFYFHGMMLHWVNLCCMVVLAMIELINIMTERPKHSICSESNSCFFFLGWLVGWLVGVCVCGWMDACFGFLLVTIHCQHFQPVIALGY